MATGSSGILQQVNGYVDSLLQQLFGDLNGQQSDENLEKSVENTRAFLTGIGGCKVEQNDLLWTYLQCVYNVNECAKTDSGMVSEQVTVSITALLYGFIKLFGREKNTSSNDGEQEELQVRLEKLKQNLDEVKAQRDKVAAERDGFRERLKKLATQQMKSKNPLIEDLSDPSRPLKLCEEFSLLYRNEWAEAFRFLKPRGMNEKQIIAFLFSIIESCFDSSVEEANCQCKAIAQIVTGNMDLHLCNTANHDVKVEEEPTDTWFSCCRSNRNKNNMIPGNSGIKEYSDKATETETLEAAVKDFMKTVAVHSVKIIPQKIYEELAKSLCCKQLKPYVKKCAELCWLMRMQSPPIELICAIKSDEEFKPDLHERYNCSGTKINFPVWPVMLLCENGPVLAKGKVACKIH